MSPPTEWHRVSPMAIIHFALKTLPQLANFWPALGGVFAAGAEVRQWLLIYGPPGLVLVLLAFGALQYLVFRFAVEADRIQIRSGLFHRRRLTLEFDRVQQADLVHPFYFRPLGLATLGLESAGSGDREVALPGIPVARAETIRAEVMAHREAARSSEDEPLESEQPAFELTLSPREVARYGLMHNALLFLAPLAAPLGQYIGPAVEHWAGWLQSLPWTRVLVESGWAQVWVTLVMAVVFVALGVVALFAVSMAIATIYYWDYRLVRWGDRYQARFGLGTRRTRSMRRQKIQRLQITQGMIARALRRSSLLISKAGHFRQGQAQLSQRFVIPVLTAERLADLRTELGLEPARWQRIHPWYIADHTLTWGSVGALSLFLWLLTLSDLNALPALAWSLLCYPALLPFYWRLWSQYRYAVTEHWLVLRQGFIGRREQWLPKGKLQKISVLRTPLLRLLGLRILTVWTTDGPVSFSYLPAARAEAIRDHLMAEVTGFQQPWF